MTEASTDPPLAEGADERRSPSRLSAWCARYVPDWLTPEVLGWIRWAAIATWVACFSLEVYLDGIPFDREGLLLWIVTGLAALSIGKRSVVMIAVDFVPLALVLIAYDYLRGFSDHLGMPTWWHPQINVDKFLFFGHVPTVWAQETFKDADVRWWDVVVCLCYNSFFFLPYVTAGVLWLRSRVDFYRWTGRFVGLSFLGFALFALIPASPPWAAARCTPAQVADHPSNPACMRFKPQFVPDGGLLGPLENVRPGAHDWVERISGKGYSQLHLSSAEVLLTKAQGAVNLVAAVPSLHLGGTTLFAIFMWRRVRRAWRPVLFAYPLVMTFSLVYSAEHYVSDCIAGALVAVLVCVLAARVETRVRLRREGVRGQGVGQEGDEGLELDVGR